MKNFFKYTLLFVIVVLLQVLLFNNMNLFGLVNIYIYLIFLISLPVGMSRDLQMVLAFLLGLCVDVFTNTLGMNIFASVLVAFVRNSLLGRLYNRQELEASVSPSIKTIGRPAFLKFVFFIVLLHHTVLFFLEDPEFKNVGHTLLMILCSVPVSYLFIVCYYLLKKN